MQIKVQITVKSGRGEPEAIREVARLERGLLQPDTLGLSLAEARAILAGLEQTITQHPVAEFIAQSQRCPRCGRDRTCKGHHRVPLPLRVARAEERQPVGGTASRSAPPRSWRTWKQNLPPWCLTG